MFLLPRKRRSTASTVEAATSNQRVRLTPLESHPTIAAAAASSSSVSQRDSVASSSVAPPREFSKTTAAADRTLFTPSSTRAAGVVDGKRVYPCRVCGFRFSASSNRSRHERNKHAEPTTEQGAAAAAEQPSQAPHRILNSSTPPMSSEDACMEDRDEMDADEVEMMDASQQSNSGSSLPEPIDLDMSDIPPMITDSRSRDATSASAAALTELAADASPHEPLGVLALLQDTRLQSECLPFLRWMCTPPITQVEALVKARRVTSMTQLQPIKLNLRFLFGLLLEAKAIDALDLQSLTRLAVCQALNAALEQRQVSHGRIHAMFLLVKKVLVFLSTQESTRRHQFLAPTMHESFLFVENVCSDSSHRRKQDARNRAVLGVQTSKTLQALNGSRQSPSTLSPDAFTMPSLLGAGSDAASMTSSRASTSPPVSPQLQQQHTSSSASSPSFKLSSSSSHSSTDESELLPSPNELTSEELKVVAKGALAYLQQHRESETATVPSFYIHHLVTATLCLGLAPRSQVLKQLRIGSSFAKEADGCYKVNMLAELNKNGKPTSFVLPKELSEPFDFYLATLRPRLLREQGQEHDYVFFKRNGTAPRADFSDLTTVATQQLIGRPVNPHAFRSAVITTFYETGATQSQMDVLASLMSHSSETARSYYFKPQMAKAAVETNNRMLQALELANESSQ